MSDFHARNAIKTRKDHKCEGCFELIPKGTEVTHCKGKWEGEFYDYHMCDPCLKTMDDVVGWDFGFTPGEVRELNTRER
ncbi:MAG: hypothetical protein K0Q73_5378 [Paenibacillus sp.]|jgi:hypothetical protein|nr:hypothetical protein [Paenibacillus sp.]